MNIRPDTIVHLVIFALFKFELANGQGNMVNVTGDVIIGAMFPIHNLYEGAKCGTIINEQTGIQNLEALLFALEKANAIILKGLDFKLGVTAYDTCYSDTVVLDRALQFVKLQTYSLGLESLLVCNDSSKPTPVDSGKLIGVVGAATSSVSIQLASFLRLFKIPQISYSATSTELSDTKRYDYFMRTIASDEYQASAIVQILSTFQWDYVVGIYDDTSYGVNGFQQIREQAKKKGVCIAKEYEIKRYFSSEATMHRQVEDVVKSLGSFNNTHGQIVVILFASDGITNVIFDLAHSLYSNNKFIWVGSDAWAGYKIHSNVQPLLDGALGVQPKIQPVPEFDEYYMKLNPQNNKKNPWFKDYWEQIFNCSVDGTSTVSSGGKHVNTLPKCKSTYKLSMDDGTYERNLNTYSVMDAVYAFATALKTWHKTVCPGTKSFCKSLTDAKPEDLMDYLRDVEFTDPAGFEFAFHNNSGPARYSIMQYTYTTQTGYEWKEVGNVTGNGNFSSNIIWNDLIGLKSTYKESICSVPCNPGEAKQSVPSKKCCWTCVPCHTSQYLQVDNQTCIDCPNGKRPNRAKTSCEDIPETTMDMTNVWAIISIFLSCIGIVVTCLIGVLFYWQKKTPVIMASGKELSFVLLAGILLSYLSTFTFVAHPTPFSCGATRLLLGSSYTICYAAILVKTNRIYRVFNIHISKPKKVKFISAKSQLLITFGIVAVELAALTSWMIFDEPIVMHEYPTPADNVRVCEDSMDFAYLGALVYPLFLMIMCVYYAIKTRKTPDGFNETRYVTFGSYSFCVLWIAFTSIYFSVKNNTIRIVALCFASTINATVTLITLFITKAYVVLFRPQKNTRENVMSRRRTHSYDTVDIHNLSNLSRMASAVSTWHSVNPTTGSQLSQTPSVINGQQGGKKFGTNLSISVVSMNNLGASNDSLYSSKTTVSAPPIHRPFSEEEMNQLPFRTSKKDLGDERLKQFLDFDRECKSDEEGVEDRGINSGVPRRSLKSFRSRKKRMRSVKRTRSMDPNVPHIIVTASSMEDTSKIIDRSRTLDHSSMVKVIHL